MSKEFPALLYIIKTQDFDSFDFLGTEKVNYDDVTDGEGVAVYELKAIKTVAKRPTLVD